MYLVFFQISILNIMMKLPTALCNFLVEIDFSNSDGSDFLRDLLGQRSMMRERDLSGPAEQNGLNGPGLTFHMLSLISCS